MNILANWSPENKIRQLKWKMTLYKGRKTSLQRQIFTLMLAGSDLDTEDRKKYRRLIQELQDCELCLQAVRNLYDKYE